MELPKAWTELLARIQAVAPEALLGGGALRDLDNGAEVKDLDIFVSEDNVKRVAKVVRETHPEVGIENHEPYFTWDTSVRYVAEFRGEGIPVNVIGLSPETCNVKAQLARFDFGICQIIFDGKEVYTSNAYHTDKHDRTFTLTRHGNEEQTAHSLARYQRISGKYPGWTLVTPEPLSVFDL